MIKKSLVTILILFLSALSLVAMIYFGQDRMIYFPRGYSTYSKLFSKVDQVSYQSGECTQTAFLYPAVNTKTPETVWWLFGGNGSTALDWVSMLERTKFPEGHVFVLVEYPGYGRCQGKPCPQSIYDSTDDLFRSLSERWSIEPEALSDRSMAMGHSLGAAIALHTAAKFEMRKVIAVAPFTTMGEMAKRRVGKLHVLLKHPYDNRDSVRRLVSQANPAKLYIFHGNRDSLIPNSMGKELADLAGIDHAVFRTVQGRGHNDILYGIRDDLNVLLKEKD